jgi:hypothetical protein
MVAACGVLSPCASRLVRTALLFRDPPTTGPPGGEMTAHGWCGPGIQVHSGSGAPGDAQGCAGSAGSSSATPIPVAAAGDNRSRSGSIDSPVGTGYPHRQRGFQAPASGVTSHHRDRFRPTWMAAAPADTGGATDIRRAPPICMVLDECLAQRPGVSRREATSARPAGPPPRPFPGDATVTAPAGAQFPGSFRRDGGFEPSASRTLAIGFGPTHSGSASASWLTLYAIAGHTASQLPADRPRYHAVHAAGRGGLA